MLVDLHNDPFCFKVPFALVTTSVNKARRDGTGVVCVALCATHCKQSTCYLGYLSDA